MKGFTKKEPTRDELKLIVNTVLAASNISYWQMYGDIRRNPDHPSNIHGRAMKWFGVRASDKKYKKLVKRLSRVLPKAYTIEPTVSGWGPGRGRRTGFKLVRVPVVTKTKK